MTKCKHCGAENPPKSAFCEKCGKPIAAAAGSGEPALQTLSDLQTRAGDLPPPRHAAADSQTLEPGAVFADRYTVESVIGTGGMGVVYRAKDKIGNRDVALKLIRADRIGGESAVQRLISEGVLTQDLRHKNIVAVYDVNQIEGQPYLAMEYVNGVSLREWQRKQVTARADVGMKVAARIVAEILDGLRVAHDMGVIHRDLKPENVVLVGEPGEDAAPLKLLDFGIASAAGKYVESSTGTGLGTPRYMAPEQITAPESAGPSADLYSLSTIFYELLVGVLPQGGWQAPSSGRPDVPTGVDALIQSGLQNRPASRPQSVADYRARLDAAIGGAPVPVDPGGDVQPVDTGGESRVKQAKWLKIGGGVFAGMVALGVLANLGNGTIDNGGGGTGGGGVLDGGDGPTDEGDDMDGGGMTVIGGEGSLPPPPPPPPTYAQLSGQWLDDFGGALTISVSDSGSFSGSGSARDGSPFMFEGAFSGRGASYNVSNGAGTFPGQLAWDGRDCHLDFRTMYPNGAVALQGRFHVNHPPTPGAPCPAGWPAR